MYIVNIHIIKLIHVYLYASCVYTPHIQAFPKNLEFLYSSPRCGVASFLHSNNVIPFSCVMCLAMVRVMYDTTNNCTIASQKQLCICLFCHCHHCCRIVLANLTIRGSFPARKQGELPLSCRRRARIPTSGGRCEELN